MENKYYLRIENNDFGFIVEGLHDITEKDIEVSNEDYNKFFELQCQGKRFRLKEVPTGLTLFDYIEEFEVEPEPIEPGMEEYILNLDYRISMLELGY